MLDPHRLRVFHTVVATGSMHGAAAQLGYTPSAVSQHVAALQRETGLTLVERDGRGIAPTAAGLRLAAESATVLGSLAGLDAVARDLREGRTGTLTLRYFASAGAAWVPAVVGTLTRELPGLRFELRLFELASPTEEEPDLEVYVAQPDGSPAVDPTRYDVLELITEPYLAAVRRDHPLASRDEIRMLELADEDWIDNDVTRGPCRAALLAAAAAVGVVPRFTIQTHDFPTALEFVAAGVGITVLPRLGVRQLPDDVRIVPFASPGPTRTIMVRSRRALRGHPAVRRAQQLLRQQAIATAGF